MHPDAQEQIQTIDIKNIYGKLRLVASTLFLRTKSGNGRT
jgi:hypothetical protein